MRLLTVAGVIIAALGCAVSGTPSSFDHSLTSNVTMTATVYEYGGVCSPVTSTIYTTITFSTTTKTIGIASLPVTVPVTVTLTSTNYVTVISTQSPVIESSSLIASESTDTVTSVRSPSVVETVTSVRSPTVVSAKLSTYLITDYTVATITYTHSLPGKSPLPSNPPDDTQTGSVIVIVSHVTVLSESYGFSTVTPKSSSPVLETHTLTVSDVRTIISTVAPETTVAAEPMLSTSPLMGGASFHGLNATTLVNPSTTPEFIPSMTAFPKGGSNASAYGVSSAFNTSWSANPMPSRSSSHVPSNSLDIWTTSSYPTAISDSSDTPVSSNSVSSTTPAQTTALSASKGFQANNTAVSTGTSSSSAHSSTVTATVVLNTTALGIHPTSTAIGVQNAPAAGIFHVFTATGVEHITASVNLLATTPLTSSATIAPALRLQSETPRSYPGGPLTSGSGTQLTAASSSSSASSVSAAFGSYNVTSLSVADPTMTVDASTLGPVFKISIATSTFVPGTSVTKSASKLATSSAPVVAPGNSEIPSSSSSNTSAVPTFVPGPYTNATTSPSTAIMPTFSALAGSSTTTLTDPTRSTTSSAVVISASTASSGPLASSTCGEHGNFTLDFEDVPIPNPAKKQNTPIFSPYHQFYFSEDFYVKAISTFYKPSSGDTMLEFEVNRNLTTPAVPVPGGAAILGITGSIGNGYTYELGCFRFDALGASLGCDSRKTPCQFQVTGFKSNDTTQTQDVVTTQTITVPSCHGTGHSRCSLVPVDFDGTFVDIDSIYINATAGLVPKNWFLDDLRLSWADNSCAAGLCRQSNI